MNYLYSSSWVRNTNLLAESYSQDIFLVNESIAGVVSDVMKKMKAAKIGIPYRDARLFFYEFLKDEYPDRIPPEFSAQFATSKPQGKDINALMGKIMLDEKLPEGFADKLAKKFEEYSNKEVSVGDKKIDAVTNFLNRTAGLREIRGSKPGDELKRKFGSSSDIEQAVKSASLPPASERIKKGKTGFETLQLNLTPETVFDYEDETPMGHSLYTTVKDGLKYRVTLRDASGNATKLSDISPESVASVVVTQPGTMQKVRPPTPGNIQMPGVEREKPVVDYPPDVGGDFSGPDPEELARGGMAAKEELYGGDDEPIDEPEPQPEPELEPSPISDIGQSADEGDKEPGAEEITQTEKETDEPEFTATQAAERKKGYWERLKEKDPELYKKAWAKRQAALSGEEDIEPEAEKFEKPKDTEDEDKDEEDYEEEYECMKESTKVVKKSPQAIQRELLEQIRLKRQNNFKNERKNTLGY